MSKAEGAANPVYDLLGVEVAGLFTCWTAMTRRTLPAMITRAMFMVFGLDRVHGFSSSGRSRATLRPTSSNP